MRFQVWVITFAAGVASFEKYGEAGTLAGCLPTIRAAVADCKVASVYLFDSDVTKQTLFRF